MGLRCNLYYWVKSLENPEPILDRYYKDDNLIVSDSKLIDSIRTLRDLIKYYCDEINTNKEEIVNKIIELLTSKDLIQYSEFVAFWKVFDLSYSVFKDLSDEDKKKIIIKILEDYCKKRIAIYEAFGYSNIIIQALYDSGASRKKGKAGIEKLIEITRKITGDIKNILNIKNILENCKKDYKNEELFEKEKYYLIPDENQKLFEALCNHFGIKFNSDEQSQNKSQNESQNKNKSKKPDLVVKLGKHILIIEAKHVKEMGGQIKQVEELIKFIKQKGNTSAVQIHYVAFLDGLYFNKFIEYRDKQKTKDSQNNNQSKNTQEQDCEEITNTIEEQFCEITKALQNQEYKNNFFVNTYGYTLLIKDLNEELKNDSTS